MSENAIINEPVLLHEMALHQTNAAMTARINEVNMHHHFVILLCQI